MKILIIEDEIQLQEAIKKSLEQEKYLVEVASDFRSAREKALLYSYDCILLDIMLPYGNGLELIKELKHVGKHQNIIIISAKDSLEDCRYPNV